VAPGGLDGFEDNVPYVLALLLRIRSGELLVGGRGHRKCSALDAAYCLPQIPTEANRLREIVGLPSDCLGQQMIGVSAYEGLLPPLDLFVERQPSGREVGLGRVGDGAAVRIPNEGRSVLRR
jgi:hypothetical protein